MLQNFHILVLDGTIHKWVGLVLKLSIQSQASSPVHHPNVGVIHSQMGQFGSEGKCRAFSFQQDEVTRLEEPTKPPQKSNTVNANAL